MSTTHTPGPWKVCEVALNDYWIVGSTIGAADPRDGRRICDVAILNNDKEANARLIAAAPELLEALTYLERELSAGALTLYNQKAILECDRDWLLNQASRAKAALAKAEGRPA